MEQGIVKCFVRFFTPPKALGPTLAWSRRAFGLGSERMQYTTVSPTTRAARPENTSMATRILVVDDGRMVTEVVGRYLRLGGV